MWCFCEMAVSCFLQSKEKLKGFWVPNQHGVSQEVLFLMCMECMKDVRKQISAWWVLPVYIGKEITNLYCYLVYLCEARILTDQISTVSLKNTLSKFLSSYILHCSYSNCQVLNSKYDYWLVRKLAVDAVNCSVQWLKWLVPDDMCT